MLSAKMKWTGGLKFEGVSGFGLPIATDGAKSAGGSESGYKPTELVLYGLAGCTGIDVVRIIEKQRQELNGLEIEVDAYQPENYPKPFNKIEIKFIFTGKNLNRAKVEQAVSLSEEKYCVVSQTLAGVARIVSSIEIKEG
ncbi:MAG: OsmC family protein [Candidatus Zixiibacteriota bacterium]